MPGSQRYVLTARELMADPLFAGVPPKFLLWQQGLAVRWQLRAGEILCRQGDPGNTAYLIRKGRLKVTSRPAKSKKGGAAKPAFEAFLTPADSSASQHRCRRCCTKSGNVASHMRWLELKIPPPLVALLIGVAMWMLPRGSWHVPIAPTVRLTTSIALAVLGVVVAMLGSLAFKRVGTTVNPLKPNAASALVTSGIYRYTRNPMYVGVATVLLGWAIYLAAPLAIVGPLAFVAYITRFQIIPEERALSVKFGGEFAEYQARVHRWL